MARAVEDILARLVPSETEKIERRAKDLDLLDRRLSEIAKELEKSDGRLAEGEQAHRRAKNARAELASFAAAGVDRLHRAGREHQAWKNEHFVASNLRSGLAGMLAQFTIAPDVPQVDEALLQTVGIGLDDLDANERRKRVLEHIEAAISETDEWIADARKIVEALANRESGLRAEVERALGERGLGAAKLREFQELERQASLLTSYADALEKERFTQKLHQKSFEETQHERRDLLGEQRSTFEHVTARIDQEFSGRIHVQRIDHGDAEPLERFLAGLRQRGVTRWWNELPADRKPSPESLVYSLETDTLGDVGMTDAVQETFRECMTRSRMRELAALRCPDRYVLAYRIDGGDYRPLDELSGGRRVGVLLSLLLETADNRPLVIDQPEDELDNRFLFDTVLPALKRLRGRRQVILATHNANIVVNGDADMVIQLEAGANRGRIACAGAIEEPATRNAIVRTVDGGEEAFRLRRRKYGF